jgi:N-acetylmuramoyl-L-alanine amidase
MDGKSLLLISGGALLGIGALVAAFSGEETNACAGGACTANAMPQTNTCTGSPMAVTPPVTPPDAATLTVARTAWGEARGEGTRGMQAVINVVMNRARAGTFPGGRNPAAICTAKNQFSAWNIGDPNRSQMLAVTTDNSQFRNAITLARQGLAGTLADLTDGAVYYHEANIPTPPSWGRVAETTQIGNHIFYVPSPPLTA